MNPPAQPELMARKATLRKQVLAGLANLPAQELPALSAQACGRLQQQTRWQNAVSILGYAPMPGELDVWPALLQAMQDGKQLSLLRFDPATRAYAPYHVLSPADLVPGYFGIREPAPHCPAANLMRLDFVLVPGIAFDLRGRRLGRGRGHYDRVLPAARGVFCAVAFDQQVVGEVPVAPHDASVSCILTPTRWIEVV